MVKRSETCANERNSQNAGLPVRRSGMSTAVTKKKNFSAPVQRIFRWIGKTVMRYDLLHDGDRIVVGVSGVDSLSMLWLLRERLAWIPITYTLKAVYIDLGFDDVQGELIEQYLKDESYDYSIVKTNIGLTAHSEENRKNPCFYCAWQRRKKLFQICRDSGFNKIALGHHLEDINTTLFVNIIFGGSVSTMVPCQKFFGGEVTIIRPLALVYKEQLQGLADYLHLPSVDNPCPSAKISQRKEVEEFLQHFYRKDPRIRYTVFNALSNVHPEYLPEGMVKGEE
ncbi:MAG TPA: ATP-binding protein [Thermodesulfobacteriota bacterium]|nr:adenine nucleotide alpha hydrolase family protein [Deltaproteobacteria bacterium]HNU72023.1 ATP-binding protein [Thermodesulfobacteriota bacterium]HOC37759.1 ATP-binding protein [Thermodesulfobacteriota bacterium]HQO77953.1 ATP-binding protein [Thermodesulfobacteriota bacterium]